MNKKYDDRILYKVFRPIITILVKIFFTPKIIGDENIPKEGKVILAGNHTSIFDCLLLISSTKRSIHFLAKKELFKGFKKVVFDNLGLIPVDRDKKEHRVLEESYAYLNNDKVIGIFPEGTTEKGRGLLHFKIGAVKMASETNSKIVPFVITGRYTLFSRTLKIKFLGELEVKDELSTENERLRSIIENNLEE